MPLLARLHTCRHSHEWGVPHLEQNALLSSPWLAAAFLGALAELRLTKAAFVGRAAKQSGMRAWVEKTMQPENAFQGLCATAVAESPLDSLHLHDCLPGWDRPEALLTLEVGHAKSCTLIC